MVIFIGGMVMSNYITKIGIKEYYNGLPGFSELTELSSAEDVATLLDTFEVAGTQGRNIVKVLEGYGKYIFVEDENTNDFDFFAEINKLSTLNVEISPLNAKLLFPKSISRGYYTSDLIHSSDVNTGNIGESDETPTGFLDDDDISELRRTASDGAFWLYHIKKGVRLPINDEHGIIFGRSTDKSEYEIANSKVSRIHAKVYKSGNKVMVHDYDSVNGTYIDGLRVKSNYDREISEGSVLRLADEDFRLM